MYFNPMWNQDFIDKQLLFRLRTNNIKIEIKDYKFTGGRLQHIYFYKSKQIFLYIRTPQGELNNNNFIINSILDFDPKEAVLFSGRKRSWGKRIIISKCGDSDLEKFNYVSELIYNVIKKFQ